MMMQSLRRSVQRVAAVRPSTSPAFASAGISTDATATEAELSMHSALQKALEAVHVKVSDVSGGCGSMFDIEVASAQFAGQSRVKQHRMVNEVKSKRLSSGNQRVACG